MKIFISGASSGIGKALALELGKQHEIVVAARRENELRVVAEKIRSAGGKAEVCVFDVQNPEAARATLLALDDRLGGIDMVIANAGIGSVGAIKKMSWEKIATMCNVNFTGAIATLTALLPRMVSRKHGHLVGVSSLMAEAPVLPGSLIYQSTKVALSTFLAGLRLELDGSGVQVTCVQPGFVHTEMTEQNKNMPFVMEADAAAALIARKLRRAPTTISFPLPMTLGLAVSHAIPGALKKLVTKRMRVG